MLKKHCCTQTSEDSEEKDPPAPEDKNLLKVKKKKSNKQPTSIHQLHILIHLTPTMFIHQHIILQ